MGNRHLIYLFNAQKRETTAAYWLNEVANIEEAYLYQHGSALFVKNKETRIVCKIPAHSGVLYFADTQSPIMHAPSNLWDWES